MPRKKLDVTQAFAALSRQSSLPREELVIIEPEQVHPNRGRFNYGPTPRPGTPKLVQVHLHNTHSIGLQSYGPGLCMVEPDVATQLLYQEQVAQRIDERTFDTRQRFYQIFPVPSGGGGFVYRGVPVGDLTMTGMLNRVSPEQLMF